MLETIKPNHWQQVILLSFGLVLFGCPSSHSVHLVPITRHARMPLLPPEQLGKKIQASQIFTSYQRGKRRVLFIQLEVDAQSMTMVGLTPVGVKLFVLSFKKRVLSYKPAPFFKASIHPRHVLADFQLVFWPRQTLQKAIQPLLRLEEQIHNQRRVRLFYANKAPLIRITYQHKENPWKGTIRFEHLERKYHYSIQTTQAREFIR